ncbi:DNA-binding response regulator [Clostridia bacterium]|nr:DNA-binding response regulator [Clostridia bacterium]
MPRIFLVEDDNAIAKNLTLLLRSECFTVTHAPTQSRAIAALDDGKFDLALIDISLPDGNGFSVCTAVKAGANIPVIFLTASTDEVSVVTGLNMGADDYITKPFRPMELIARIKAALRKSGHAPSTFEIASLHIDTASGNVTKNGQEVFLSALEYRLLLVFLNNQTAIITRNQLLDELWDGLGEFVNDNTLTVYIKRLREKIEDDPAEPKIILTVRGMGYKFGMRNSEFGITEES